MAKTTIQISTELKNRLDALKVNKRETYEDVIENLLEDSEELSDATKKDIEEALTQIERGDFITHEDLKRNFGLS